MAAKLFFTPIPAVLSRGLPAAGAQIFFYLTGTLTETPAYTASDLLTSLSNPVVADGAGQLPPIYLNDTITYRVRITDKDGILIPGCDIDPYTPGTLIALQGLPGVNGAVGSNAGFSALFSAAGGMTIGAGITSIRTAGYSVAGKGAAIYVYDAAVNSAFVTAHPKWSFLAADGRGFRLDDSQRLMLEMVGAAGDASTGATGTDDYAAFVAAMDFQNYFRFAPSGNTDYKPAPAFYLSNKGYRSSQTLIMDRTANRFFGSGNNFNGFGASAILFDSGQAGIVIQCWDNTGTDLTEVHTPHTFGTDPRGAQCTHLADISLYSRGGSIGSTSQNGVLIHTSCLLERVHCFDFSGNGIALRADVASGTNANACQIISCGAQRCGLNGYYDQGGDVNAGQVLGFQAFANRQFGLYAGNFLGQFYPYFQCDGNGTTTSGPSWATKGVSSFTNYSGHIWYVRPGQHVAASTTTPGTNAGIWIDQGAGSTSLGGNWVSGQTFTSGGGFYAGGIAFGVNNNGRNVFAGYCENNQYGGWSDSNTSCYLPGFAGFNGGSGAGLGAANGALVSSAIGYRGLCANGDIIQFLLGAAGATDGTIWTFGRDPTGETNWKALLDASNILSFLYGGANGSSPLNLIPGTTVPGSNFPRGASFAVSSLTNAANDAAAATAGVAVGTLYRNGSVVMVRVS